MPARSSSALSPAVITQRTDQSVPKGCRAGSSRTARAAAAAFLPPASFPRGQVLVRARAGFEVALLPFFVLHRVDGGCSRWALPGLPAPSLFRLVHQEVSVGRLPARSELAKRPLEALQVCSLESFRNFPADAFVLQISFG